MIYYSFHQRHFLFQVLILFGSFMTTNAVAHDFWLEAQPFYTTPGKAVDISVHVGSGFHGDSLPNIDSWYTDFSVYQTHSKSPVQGELGRDPAGYFTPSKKGTYAIGYQSTFSYAEIDSDTFLTYLTKEGLDDALQYRQQNRLTETMGKENFMRHAKVLVQAGDGFEVDHSGVNFGYELEIIPLSNPYKKALNDTLKVKILYQNKPIKNILLHAFSKAKPEQTQQWRSDNYGEVRITLNQSGPWLLKAVKIVKIDDDKANWQSHWASLTFTVN